jgi:ADP-heptose:LPS heptosyltransferase
VSLDGDVLAVNGLPDRPVLVVLRALGLGDLLTAVPALRALAHAFPDHRRLLAAPAVLGPLARLTGAVHATVDTAPLAPLRPSLWGADVAVNLHGRGPQSHRVLLAARPRRLIAFAHPAVRCTRTSPPWPAEDHEVVRWCRLLAAHGIAADPERLELGPPGIGAVAPERRNATILHPGAASPARRWPADRWGAVARAEAEQGRPVLVTAGPGEEGLAASVVRAAGTAGGPGGPVKPAGPTDLLHLAALVAAAERVVCGDTGVAHLATAFGTPSVVLFGPTSPDRWGPPPGRTIHRVLWAGREGDPHGAEPDPGLLRIGVDVVVEALAALPARSAAAGHRPEALR